MFHPSLCHQSQEESCNSYNGINNCNSGVGFFTLTKFSYESFDWIMDNQGET